MDSSVIQALGKMGNGLKHCAATLEALFAKISIETEKRHYDTSSPVGCPIVSTKGQVNPRDSIRSYCAVLSEGYQEIADDKEI